MSWSRVHVSMNGTALSLLLASLPCLAAALTVAPGF
ncbi:hypothetical protein [Azospirillum doebereinerae]